MLGLAAYFLAGVLFLSVRYLVLPNVGSWRTEIAAQASTALGAPVRIGAINADWDGFRPRLHLRRVEILDGAGVAALSLEQVDATLAWSSLIRWQPYFDRLAIVGPEVSLARDAQGLVSVGGLPIQGGGDGGGLQWLLDQRQIIIRNATLTWNDALRAAPPLVLEGVDLRLMHDFRGYRAGVTARSSSGVLTLLDARADFRFGEAGKLATLDAESYVHVRGASIEAMQPWFDLPMEMRGQGEAALWLTWRNGLPTAMETRFALAGAGIRFSPDRPALDLDSVSGGVSLARPPEGYSVTTRQLTLKTAGGIDMPPTDVSLRWTDSGAQKSVELEASELDLGVLSHLGQTLPLTDDQAEVLGALAPRGRFKALKARLEVTGERTTAWSLTSGFEALSVNATERWPGVSGLSGRIDGDAQAGRYSINSSDMALEMPKVFVEPIGFSHLMAEGSWGQEADRQRFSISTSSFENSDLKGEASGHYFLSPAGPGDIDLQARLSEANGAAVWRYLPVKVNDHTREWLKRGIVRGKAQDARLRFKGPLARFPFRQPGEGIFLITAQVNKALLDYAPNWPRIDAIEGALRFDGPRMTITASQGVISGVKLSQVVADVPDLANGNEAMTITGQADGKTRDFLQFIEASPVSARINGFTTTIDAEGAGHLDLRLDMPLRHVKDTAVDGRYRFADNRLRLREGLPWMTQAGGTVAFTGNSLSIEAARAKALGGVVTVGARTVADGAVEFNAEGEAHADALASEYPLRAFEYLSGATPWQLKARVGKGRSQLEISSTLVGLGASLPEPFNKSAQTAWPTRVTLDFVPGEPVALQGAFGSALTAQLSIPRDAKGDLVGGVGIGAPVRSADDGVFVAWHQKYINLDRWQDLLGESDASTQGFRLAGVSVAADEVRIRSRVLHELSLKARQKGRDWNAEVRSREAEGTISWIPEAEGRLVARLSRLTLGKAEGESGSPSGTPAKAARSFPALDVEAEKFGVNGLDLGRLKLSAFNRAGVWHLNALNVDTGQSRLSGSGQWAPGGDGRTEMDFTLETQDVGRLLTRLDFPDAVQRGTATLSGKVSWRGAPSQLDYPSMNGAFELLAEAGQFRKLDPGVGRLLGVLSLQSLPRRITLDFRDVFSEGFAFDRISGSIEMANGVLSTEGMQIRGPAANILMSGDASVPAETQHLRVKVQPTLSESVAVGAALGGAVINPVAGVVTYIVQKALEDPVEKFFAFEYEVTGTWNDPLVKKLSKKESATPAAETPAGQVSPLR